MRILLPLTLLATPAFAHPGAHLHPHDGGSWMLVIALLALAGAVVCAVKVWK